MVAPTLGMWTHSLCEAAGPTAGDSRLITSPQGHPGSKWNNLDSNSGLTLGLCSGKTRILKRQRLRKAAKKDGCGEVRVERKKGRAPDRKETLEPS